MEKRRSLIDYLSEDVRFTPEKVKSLLEKYVKDIERYEDNGKTLFNKISNTAIGDILEEAGFNSTKRIAEACDKLIDKLDNDWNKILELGDHMSEEYDETNNPEANDLYDKCQDTANQYKSLSDAIELVKNICEGSLKYIEKAMDSDKIKYLEKFK